MPALAEVSTRPQIRSSYPGERGIESTRSSAVPPLVLGGNIPVLSPELFLAQMTLAGRRIPDTFVTETALAAADALRSPARIAKRAAAPLAMSLTLACNSTAVPNTISIDNTPADKGKTEQTSSTSPEPPPPVSLTPGIGGPNPIPTFPAEDPRAVQNPSIDEANRRADEAAAKAAAIAQPNSEANSASDKSKASEVKKVENGIVSPEAGTTGEYIEWTVSSGDKIKGMGFILKPGEEIRIRENLQVAGVEIKQPNTYTGQRITAVSKDGRRYGYFGDIVLAPNLSNVGKDSPAGTVVGTIAGSGITVFKDAPYNFVVLFPDDMEMEATFVEQTKIPPKVINNTPQRPLAGGGSIFYGVTPPQGGG